ncbi:YwlB [Bacillus tequilensis]|nr:YwlB [Bacillus tequilensis]
MLEEFLKQAKTNHEGVKEDFAQFLMLEDGEKNIAGCLGIEKIGCDQGLLRSLVISDKLHQGHIVTLFQSMELLCEKHQIKTVYLIANQHSSADFLKAMGFEPAESVPEELFTSHHFRESRQTEGAVLMKKASG